MLWATFEGVIEMFPVTALCLLFQASPDPVPTRSAFVIPERVQFPSVRTVVERHGMDIDQQIESYDRIIQFLIADGASPARIEKFRTYKEDLMKLKR